MANKSQMIRDYKKQFPEATPKQIAEVLTNNGDKVSAQFVSTVLSNAKKKRGKVGKQDPKPGKKKKTTIETTMDELVQAKKVVDELGGLTKAREIYQRMLTALDILEKLGA